ncbi:MAG: hypothetical protein Q4D98_12850, partial [Planctomycetia bacterium]|nr:hypothetical protein [Planctomycetia bacterium]
ERAEKQAALEAKIKAAFDFLEAGEDQLAWETFQEASAMDKKDVNADCVIGLYQMFQKRDTTAAYETYISCAKRQKSNPVVLNNLGVLHILKKRYTYALSCFEWLAKKNPDLPELVQNVGLFMDRYRAKKIRLDKKDVKRLVLLHAEVVKKNPTAFDAEAGYRFIPMRDGNCNRPECDKYFVRKNSRQKTPPKPFEIMR